MPSLELPSPVGTLALWEDDGHIVRLTWGRTQTSDSSDLLEEAAEQLAAYFAGQRRVFDLPLRPRGSAFQIQVCDVMSEIPFGETRSYGEIAAALGSVARAVGRACGHNPIPILIPCHRVLAAGGQLGGFSGGAGLPTKRALLAHEGNYSLSLDL